MEDNYEKIHDMLCQMAKWTTEKKMAEQSSELFKEQISIAENQIAKGIERKDILRQKTEFLKESVDEEQQKINEVRNFWTSLGLHLKSFDANHYEVEFKIKDDVYPIDLTFVDNEVQITSQKSMPDAFITKLKADVNSNFVSSSKVDWRCVIVFVWKSIHEIH